jgi:DNA-binding transcriptional LysR family regulator
VNKTRPLDTRQLQAFDDLCKTGSYTQTAKHLRVTQSAVSHSLRTLEKELGCKLFQKRGNKLLIAPSGDVLLAFTRPWFEEMEKVRGEISLAKNDAVIRLGASDQICRFLLPELLKVFSASEPQCKFQINGLNTRECLDLLKGREVDLALTVEPEENKKYPFIPCFSDELVMVVPRDHEWTLKGGIDWTATGREKLILPHRKSYSYLAIQKYLEKRDIKLSLFMEMNSSETTKELIKAKMGVGILPDWFISREMNAKELVALPLGPKRLIRPWGVSISEEKPMVREERTFIKCLQKLGSRWMVNRNLS